MSSHADSSRGSTHGRGRFLGSSFICLLAFRVQRPLFGSVIVDYDT
nr:hypothetical protein JVH1_1171 [Rhodococcus sp. JVH1]